MNIYRVMHKNGFHTATPADIEATRVGLAVRRYLDGQQGRGATRGAPVKLKKGQFVTISVERIG